MKAKIVAGLDIGTSNIRIIVGTLDENKKLEIIGLGTAQSCGIVRGGITNIDKATESIYCALREAESTSGVDISTVNIGFTDPLISSELHIGSITRKNIDSEVTIEDVTNLKNDICRTLVSPGKEIVQVLPQTYKVDYQKHIKDPVGMSGIRLECLFKVITAYSSNVKSTYKCLQKVGLTANSLCVSPLAASMVILSKEEKSAGVCIIDIGAGTTEIAIFHDFIVKHVAILPIGSQLITDDIKNACMIMPAEAEFIKKKFGCAASCFADKDTFIEVPRLTGKALKQIPLDTLALIIEARLLELIEIIKIQIANHDILPAGIVLIGGGAKLKKITDLFEKITDIETRLGIVSEEITNSFVNNENENFSCAVGLVLSEFQPLDYRDEYYLNKKNINKQDDDQKNRKDRSVLKDLWRKTKNILIEDYNE